MSIQSVLVMRDVPANEPYNYAGRDVKAGEILYIFTLCTYGCVDTTREIALSETGDYPFFGFPLDTIERDLPCSANPR